MYIPFFTSRVHLRTTVPILLGLVVLFGGCDDGNPVDDEDDEGNPADELVLEEQLDDYSGDGERIWAGPGLAEGTIEADGRFSVTLYGIEDIEDDLEPIDPEASAFDSFLGFACEEEALEAVGSDVQFAMVPKLTYNADDPTFVGLTSQAVDITLPLPLEEGTHVRWIFAEEPVEINAECRDGNRSMSLDLAAGWNEVIIETERPGNDWLHDQFTGERPENVDWMIGE